MVAGHAIVRLNDISQTSPVNCSLPPLAIHTKTLLQSLANENCLFVLFFTVMSHPDVSSLHFLTYFALIASISKGHERTLVGLSRIFHIYSSEAPCQTVTMFI